MTKENSKRNKMAATGDDAAAMDSISRAPAAQPAAPTPAAGSSQDGRVTEAVLESPAAVPKRPNSNSDAGVETAEEAVEPADPDINELCTDMFGKMAIFLQGELTGICEDYRLLENMNKLTSLKYMEMKDISVNISRNLQDLNNKYASLQPYLDQINQIEEQVSSLEQAAYKLDAYSKKLEARFKKLEKR
ncbi:biogenesis of lysosome-related organelles complex 1 subunit 2 [Takifugu flavidus]|uniref:Biogenesis of lysosome-related organelles complex 1 subunit 2 n=1 Tax=Takifugu flavidus TaxID=433684 RepID=A0A5C6MW67_9TELE|nr:biogenesis of lysosome-related organelles complex 1 subunit 2 [Takifugu flavidus]TWW57637.1 Biogenesis of lysosome-related organelles complex 1 subunit 2 [Takifugu flavidus]